MMFMTSKAINQYFSPLLADFHNANPFQANDQMTIA
jgi:hypothetical protein